MRLMYWLGIKYAPATIAIVNNFWKRAMPRKGVVMLLVTDDPRVIRKVNGRSTRSRCFFKRARHNDLSTFGRTILVRKVAVG